MRDLLRLLVMEEGAVREHSKTPSARKLSDTRRILLEHIRSIGKSEAQAKILRQPQ